MAEFHPLQGSVQPVLESWPVSQPADTVGAVITVAGGIALLLNGLYISFARSEPRALKMVAVSRIPVSFLMTATHAFIPGGIAFVSFGASMLVADDAMRTLLVWAGIVLVWIGFLFIAWHPVFIRPDGSAGGPPLRSGPTRSVLRRQTPAL